LNAPHKPNADRLMMPGDVAKLFGVTPKSIREWANAGLLTAQRTLRGQRRYRESEVQRLLTERLAERKAVA
jgi:DNA-binding transcriptional MerR regulator